MSAPALNILLIIADQFRGDCLSCLGHPFVRTPNLDRLAARGITFTRHYTQASPCGPARASLFTGLYLMNHRSVRNGVPLDSRHPTLAQEIRAAGYAPTLFGYTDTSLDPRGRDPADPALHTYEGVLPGFDVGLMLPEHPTPWLDHLRAQGHAIPDGDKGWYRPAARTAGEGPTRAPQRYPAEASETAFLANAALAWLKEQKAPWFLHTAFIKPHPPYIASAPWHAAVDAERATLPTRAPTAREEAASHPWLAWRLPTQKRDPWSIGSAIDPAAISDRDLRQLRATYAGMIAEVDHHIGRLLAAVEERGESDRTLIVFTADHGEMLGEHWLLGKDGWFDGAYHIPLIIVDPAAPASTRGKRIAAFTEAVDLMPTLLERVGLTPPGGCDGVSLLPWLRGEAPKTWRDAAHWEFDFRDIALGEPETALGLSPDECCLAVRRGGRYKYVHFPTLPPLLYDLASDPGELRNLAADPAHAGAVLTCAQALLSWRMRHAERAFTNVYLCPEGPVIRR
ncbi:MAG: alkaline phosphatase family protein [Alphaproteobacteria bacterium]|nr:alkaline phosphatase family protein [Alphaproteobacteria bacterium]